MCDFSLFADGSNPTVVLLLPPPLPLLNDGSPKLVFKGKGAGLSSGGGGGGGGGGGRPSVSANSDDQWCTMRAFWPPSSVTNADIFKEVSDVLISPIVYNSSLFLDIVFY